MIFIFLKFWKTSNFNFNWHYIVIFLKAIFCISSPFASTFSTYFYATRAIHILITTGIDIFTAMFFYICNRKDLSISFLLSKKLGIHLISFLVLAKNSKNNSKVFKKIFAAKMFEILYFLNKENVTTTLT